jgi:hypothetical protein
MKGTPVNRILGSAVKVAGTLALIGGATAAAATPADAGGSPTSEAYGVLAAGPVTIPKVADATPANTPQVSRGVIYPGLTTGGILDRASLDSAFSQVGSPKVYFTDQPVDQLNASLLSSSCRSGGILGTFGTTTIQGGSIVVPSVKGFKPIPLPRNPAPNTVIPTGVKGLAVTLNMEPTRVVGDPLTVTGIYITVGTGANEQTLSLAVSICGAIPK